MSILNPFWRPEIDPKSIKIDSGRRCFCEPFLRRHLGRFRIDFGPENRPKIDRKTNRNHHPKTTPNFIDCVLISRCVFCYSTRCFDCSESLKIALPPKRERDFQGSQLCSKRQNADANGMRNRPEIDPEIASFLSQNPHRIHTKIGFPFGRAFRSDSSSKNRLFSTISASKIGPKLIKIGFRFHTIF